MNVEETCRRRGKSVIGLGGKLRQKSWDQGNLRHAATIKDRLVRLAIELPDAPAPAAKLRCPSSSPGPWCLFSGQVPVWNGELRHTGQVGSNLGLEDGIQAARLCGLNLTPRPAPQPAADLERIGRVVKLGGFVNAVPGFTDHPKVVNGASDLMVEVFGDRARGGATPASPSGPLPWPLGVAVEVGRGIRA